MNKDIIVIADPQVDNDSPIDHLESLSKYIWKHKPETIVHIGDHWDFPSLSSYNSMLEREGFRLHNDLAGGERALKTITNYTDMKNATRRKQYKPKKHFLMGNHENRLQRYIDAHPELDGLIDLKSFIEAQGWEVSGMCDPLWVHDICFSHYMQNPMSGRAVGGGIENKLNKFAHSFVHGHQQQFQYGRRQNLQGKPHFGVCAGAFYLHDEGYRGANNTEIRGFVHLKSFTNRYGYLDHDVQFVSMERLMQNY